jgi:hypothetical protein
MNKVAELQLQLQEMDIQLADVDVSCDNVLW